MVYNDVMENKNHEMICPKCGNKLVKNGFRFGIQRYRCKKCGYTFSVNHKQTTRSRNILLNIVDFLCACKNNFKFSNINNFKFKNYNLDDKNTNEIKIVKANNDDINEKEATIVYVENNKIFYMNLDDYLLQRGMKIKENNQELVITMLPPGDATVPQSQKKNNKKYKDEFDDYDNDIEDDYNFDDDSGNFDNFCINRYEQ